MSSAPRKRTLSQRDEASPDSSSFNIDSFDDNFFVTYTASRNAQSGADTGRNGGGIFNFAALPTIANPAEIGSHTPFTNDGNASLANYQPQHKRMKINGDFSQAQDQMLMPVAHDDTDAGLRFNADRPRSNPSPPQAHRGLSKSPRQIVQNQTPALIYPAQPKSLDHTTPFLTQHPGLHATATTTQTLIPGSSASNAAQPAIQITPQVVQAQNQQSRISPGLQKARDSLNSIRWSGPAPAQNPDVEAIKTRLRAAIDDWSGYYDADRGIGRLLHGRDDTIDDEDKDNVAYWAADMLVNLHNPSIGTKRFGKADPTTQNARTETEREELLDDRVNHMCELFTKVKKSVMDHVDSPQTAERDVLAPQESLRKRLKDMYQNDEKKDTKDGKKKEKKRNDDDDTGLTLRQAIQKQQDLLKRELNSRTTPNPVRMTKEQLKDARELEKQQQMAAKKAAKEQAKAAKKAEQDVLKAAKKVEKEAAKKRKAESGEKSAPKRRRTSNMIGSEQDVPHNDSAPSNGPGVGQFQGGQAFASGFMTNQGQTAAPQPISPNGHSAQGQVWETEHTGPSRRDFQDTQQMSTWIAQQNMIDSRNMQPVNSNSFGWPSSTNAQAVGMDPYSPTGPFNSPRVDTGRSASIAPSQLYAQLVAPQVYSPPYDVTGQQQLPVLNVVGPMNNAGNEAIPPQFSASNPRLHSSARSYSPYSNGFEQTLAGAAANANGSQSTIHNNYPTPSSLDLNSDSPVAGTPQESEFTDFCESTANSAQPYKYVNPAHLMHVPDHENF